MNRLEPVHLINSIARAIVLIMQALFQFGMAKWLLLFAFLTIATGCRSSPKTCVGCPTSEPLGSHIRDDFRNMYSGESLLGVGAVFGVGAALANSDADQEMQDWYQDDVRSHSTDDVASVAKTFGEGILIIPAAACGLLIGECAAAWEPCCQTGEWGDRTMRGMLVGSPSLIGLQLATGASRPGESSAESDWIPFNDNNGVSGHSFIGAVPFISAAKMTDNPLAKTGLYAASALTGWSRVNDDDHYTSQAILGWCLAYAACSAVDRTEQDHAAIRFTAVSVSGGVGMGVVFER